MCLADIARPNCSGQAVVAVVGTGNDFLGIGERHCHHHRSEDFFLHDLHVFFGVDEHGGFDEVPTVATLVPAYHGFRAFGESGFQVSANAIHLFF